MKITYNIIMCVFICTLDFINAGEVTSNVTANLKTIGSTDSFSNMADGQLRDELSKQNLLSGTGQENVMAMRKLRVELARRGDKEEHRRIVSSLQSSNLLVQSQAIEDVAKIGDTEAIYALGEMLSDPNPGGRITFESPGGKSIRSSDEAVEAPRLVAAQKLASLIASPPVPPIGDSKKFYTDTDVEQWRAWWNVHKTEYQHR